MNPKLHFQRFEFKYLIDSDQEAHIKKHIRDYVILDEFASDGMGGEYEVISLYYDSPGFYYYKQKMDGAMRRKKIRLRTYKSNGQFFPYAFFEIKRKHDVVILKDRFLMTRGDYEKLIENDDFHSTEAIRDQHRKNIIKEFEWERHLRAITPKILISYIREPYLGKLNKNFRITFDKNIKAIENDNLYYIGNDWEDVSNGKTIMEIKFNGMMPFYIRDIIESMELERTSYSKYCMGVDACASLSVEDRPYRGILEKHTFNLRNSEPVWEIF